MWFCLLFFYLFFSHFSSSSEYRNSHQLCSIGDACGDCMMMGGSGYISGGSVGERETFFFARAILPPVCPDLFIV